MHLKPGCAQKIFQVAVLLIIIKTTRRKKRKRGFLAWTGEEISHFALSRLLFFNSINGEIMQFHVVVVQWRQRNEPNCVPHVKSCSFATDLILLLFWTHLTKILLLQKKGLRLIFFANRNVHAIPLFIVANILPISFLYFKSVSYLMHYIHTNTAPSKIVNCSRRHHLFMHITQDHPLKMICTSKNLIL